MRLISLVTLLFVQSLIITLKKQRKRLRSELLGFCNDLTFNTTRIFKFNRIENGGFNSQIEG